jgi:hypothetical protein
MTLRGCHIHNNQSQLQLAIATPTQGNNMAEYHPLSQTARGRTIPSWFLSAGTRKSYKKGFVHVCFEQTIRTIGQKIWLNSVSSLFLVQG